jgi:hypothetical protein
VGAEGLRSIVTREDADIIVDPWQHSGETHHSGFTHFDMKIAQVENFKAVKCFWQVLRDYIMSPHFNLSGISLPASIDTCELEA